MSASTVAGKVQTVLGPLDPAELGVTLPHEHLLIDLSWSVRESASPEDRERSAQPIRLENLGWVRQHWQRSRPNLILDDEGLALQEAVRYREAGGGAIVDVTSNGIGRNPEALVRISKAAGLHVVMGSGYYVGTSLPTHFHRTSEQRIADEIVRDVTVGVGDTGVRSGVIGEIGTSSPISPDEEKSVRAAIEAQKRTGAPLSIHVGRHPDVAFHVLDILQDAGADTARTILCHMDRTLEDRGALREVAESGVTLEYDLFGIEASYLPGSRFPMPSDAQRLQRIEWLIEDGHVGRIVVSQDVCMKIRLERYGGTGYGHILRDIVPWMRERGFTQRDLDAILVDNPRRLLTLV